MKKPFFLLLLIIVNFFLTPIIVKADKITCDYQKAGLTFTYEDANPKPQVTSDFISGEKYFNFLGLIESGEHKTVTQHIDMNQQWYAQYHDTPCACPTKLYVCTKTLYSWNLPTLNGIGGTIAVNVLQVIDKISEFRDKYSLSQKISNYILKLLGFKTLSEIISDELINEIGEHAYSRYTLNQRDLYILTEAEYKKSELYDKGEGVRIFNDTIEMYVDNLEYRCGSSGCEFWSIDILKYMFAYYETYWDTIVKVFTSDQLVLLGVEEIECKTVEYSGECDSFDVNCDFFVKSETDYKKLITKYNNCHNDSACEAGVLNEIHQQEKKIDAQCDNVLKNYLYSDAQKDCVKKCANLKLIFHEWREGSELHDINLGGQTPNQCNLSVRIVSWIMKVIQWIRYIVPVLLILLSVMDFMKAVASDSDDEIRKVGVKFVKRLIVAALIFLLPLVLEFLLGTFGIGTNNYCL